jgi:hypothetical protein
LLRCLSGHIRCGILDFYINYDYPSLSITSSLKSSLTNRHFRVKVDNEFSDLLPIHAGVPQSSVLGPLLYTSDLPSSPDTTTARFLDDTAVLVIDPNAVAASQKLQISLDTIHHWLSLC